MAIISLASAGTFTLGNYSNDEALISTACDTSMEVLKTLDNGVWKSWTKGAPSAFQGFLSLKPGRGYVATTLAASNITLTDNTLDPNIIEVFNGKYNLLCPAFDLTLAGYTTRIKGDIFKTILGGAWKSWTEGAPSAFQGFTTMSKERGYVINVTETFDTVLMAQEDREGIKYPVVATMTAQLINGENADGIGYTDPNDIGTFMYSPKTFDNSVPALVMFADVGGILIKLDYASEYEGDTFIIELSDSTQYEGIFGENISPTNPTILTVYNGATSGGGLYISYNKVIYGTQTPRKNMYFDAGGIVAKIEFSTEYIGSSINVFSNGVGYIGSIGENNDKTNPSVLTVIPA